MMQRLSFPEYLRYPNWGCAESGSWDRVPIYVRAPENYLCGVFPAPRSGKIAKIHFFTDAIVKSGSIDVRVERLDDSTGHPSSELWGELTKATVPWKKSYELMSANLSNPASVIQGEMVAVKISPNSDSIPWGRIGYYDQEIYSGVPYNIADMGWRPVKNPYPVSLWVEYSDGSMPNISWQRRLYKSGGMARINNSLGRRYGIRFKLPAGGVISGVQLQICFGTGRTTVELYPPVGTNPVGMLEIDGNNVQAVGQAQPTYHLFLDDYEAQADEWYRLVFRTVSGTGAYHVKFGQVEFPGGWDFITESFGNVMPVHYTASSSSSASVDSSDWKDDIGGIVPMAVLLNELIIEGEPIPQPKPRHFIVVDGELAVFNDWEELKQYIEASP